MPDFTPALLELLTRASTLLPPDVTDALACARQGEAAGSTAEAVLGTLLDNRRLAEERRLPLCQDTGMIHFFVQAPDDFPRRRFRGEAEAAVVEATRLGLLRQNCVETLTGRNTGNNLGHVSPVFHWEESDSARREARVTVLLKGGGSENMGRQYSLPDAALGAGRDLAGVEKCLLDAVYHAQGKGCAPGILGVCLGGDREGGAEEAKRQLLRPFGARSPEPLLAELEERVLRRANALGVGPMGLGGRTTLLEVFIGQRTRHPACYFVTICYNCWCLRRQSLVLPY
ncbi:MAG: fumarate hydratase [Oligosphaeraceae bacterium]